MQRLVKDGVRKVVKCVLLDKNMDFYRRKSEPMERFAVDSLESHSPAAHLPSFVQIDPVSNKMKMSLKDHYNIGTKP